MKKLSAKTLIIIGISLFALILLLTVLFFSIRIAVPEVIGKNVDEGSEILKNRTFRVEIDREYSDTVPKDIIFWQTDPPGEKLRMGSTITIKVSDGIEPIEVPVVEKRTVDEAKSTLENSKFTVKISEVFSDDYEKGTVISQKTAAGKKAPKGSEIEIVVSKGPDVVEVPKITGKSLAAATQAILDAGLKIETDIKCSNSVKEGFIVSQDVKSGEMIKRNSTVFAYVSAGVANTVGNTPSNSAQWGRVAAQGNWVYYSNSNYNHYLYKMRKDGSEKQILTKDTALGINVVGEWIYYTNEDRSGAGGLYKIRIDGSQKTKIDPSINYFVHVANGWIYTSNRFTDRKIYKMKTDGTEKTLICSDSCNDICIIGNWIYYTNRDDNFVYKIRTDSSGKTKVHNEFTGCEMAADGSTIVTTDLYEYFKINTDGSGFLGYKEDNKQKSFLNANNGWVYFIEHDFNSQDTEVSAFYKMRYDTSEKTKILDLDFKNHANFFINVAGDWLYFPNDNDGDYLYRIKTDGKNLQKVYK